MFESRALSRSRNALESGSSPVTRGAPLGRTRYNDCVRGSADSIQNRHQPADSQPRNCASTGADHLPGVGARSARANIGTHSRTSNALAAASKVANARGRVNMPGVISVFVLAADIKNVLWR